ncbi:MAG: lipopolysaccharide biosynthesis protein [Gammaproteobacteria bacterium]|nr:MAG: lipopolysaccharide biosynthesis protein [Gammaproteobacteria bacterium]
MQEMMIEEPTKDLKDYLDAFRRRKRQILTIAATIFVLGVVAAFVWPPTYKSTATILIEEQEVPPDLVPSTVTSYATQRIQTISQRVMTRANLLKIIEKYDLYPDERERETTDEILERMHDDIDLEMINADVIDPRTGRPMPATIAFSLSFSGEDPEKVQKVANELVSLYLSENLKERSSKASETYSFLSEEANRLKQHIAELEKKMAEFKEKNVNRLPELMQLNTQLMDRTERELQDVDNQLRQLQDRRYYLEGQINQLDPYGQDPNLSPQTRLKALRTEYLDKLARYSPDHPDVVRLRREIEGLEKQTGAAPDPELIREELKKTELERERLMKKYSARHPDVVKMDKAIAALQAELRKAEKAAAKAPAAPKPDNPAYVTLMAQLDATLGEIETLKKKKQQLKAKLAEYEQRLTETPQVEREYTALKRDWESAVAKYQELKAKEMQARVAQQLESERKGERFTLIDPPALPEEPIKPNRPAIVVLSLILAIAAGLGYAAVAESLDTSIRGAKGVLQAVNAMPLAVIPYLESEEERRQRRTARWRAAAVTVTLLAAAVLLVHFFVVPLDVLWFRALRKVSILTGMDLVG